MEWVQQILEKILALKHIPLQDYIDLIMTPCQPLDEIGILIVAYIYHIHICIILKDTYWCTRVDKDANKCDLTFAYMGSLVFYDTRRKPISIDYDLQFKSPNDSATKLHQNEQLLICRSQV